MIFSTIHVMIMNMKQLDLRTLTFDAKAELRRLCVRLYKQGKNKSTIALELGLRRTTVNAWLVDYAKTGKVVRQEKTRGRPLGHGRFLTPEQESRIQREIVDKTPDQLKLDFALWSAKAVQQLIESLFSVKLVIRTVRYYLHRWGFTPQRPVKRAYEQQPKAVAKWLDETYPLIQQRAQEEKAEIQWGDETGVSNLEHYPRGYAPKGQTPILRLSQSKRERINMVSSITNQGKVRFMIYDEKFTAQVFIRFLEQMIKEATQKVFLILDNLKVHHSKVVKKWLEDKQHQIELFFLPSYSPELNPDEYLNNDLKQQMSNGKPARKKGEIELKIKESMLSIAKQPERVKSYFKHDKVKYAA